MSLLFCFSLLFLGILIIFLPDRYAPVKESLDLIIFSIEPWADIFPPKFPALGPRSIIWSAARIIDSSCSTTKIVFPKFLSSNNVLINRLLSTG